MASIKTIQIPFKALHILLPTEFVKMLLILFSVTLLLTTTVANEGLLQTEAAEQSHQQVSSVFSFWSVACLCIQFSVDFEQDLFCTMSCLT